MRTALLVWVLGIALLAGVWTMLVLSDPWVYVQQTW